MLSDNFCIRPLQEKDLSAVQLIEQQSYPHPWTSDQFLQELHNPIASVDLFWLGPELAGYICYWLIAGEMQILNVAIAPEFRGRGIGGSLLLHAFSRCSEQGLERAWLEVRVSNKAAIRLYQKSGFVADVVRTGYYRDGEDALLMVKEFLPTEKSSRIV